MATQPSLRTSPTDKTTVAPCSHAEAGSNADLEASCNSVLRGSSGALSLAIASNEGSENSSDLRDVRDPIKIRKIGGIRRSPRMVASDLGPGSALAEKGSLDDGRSERLSKKAKNSSSSKNSMRKSHGVVFFVGDPVPDEEARRRWPHRYADKVGECNGGSTCVSLEDDDELILDAKCHYIQASVSGVVFILGDCAHVKGEIGKPNYVGKILEFFENLGGEYYFTVQWFFRAGDTVMKDQVAFHNKQRLFFSDLKNDNLLDCIVSKVEVIQVPPSIDSKPKKIPSTHYYYDMKYSVDYSTFYSMERDNSGEKSELSSSNSSGAINISNFERRPSPKQDHPTCVSVQTDLALLDLYCGCGGMSTGLCLGAQAAGVNLVTRWAVDLNDAACETLKCNHPETQVRKESADDFYALLKEWQNLCKKYAFGGGVKRESDSRASTVNNSTMNRDDSGITPGEYEVLKLVDICYGDPTNVGKRTLKFKVRWKGYSPSEDTWEPLEALLNCQERLEDFVREGYREKILPLPGDVDVLCGGPPCQGISGLNRFRNLDEPLNDERNRQIVVFMDIVQFLKPKYALMENVVDMLRFANGSLGRYALSRLVCINYQARLGIMAAGCYGLPQFRLRAFLWGCQPCKKLPQFPLPTHDVILRGSTPVEFERNVVAYEEGQPRHLEKALVLEDVLSDLPPVTNSEVREQMPYGRGPKTEFQKYIRTPKLASMPRPKSAEDGQSTLYDHRPLQQNGDHYLRICQIPRRKGANYRDLPGVIIGSNNAAQFDPKMERVLLPSGKPLVPNYAMKLKEGRTSKPLSRLWWDEIVPTVMTVPDTHLQAMLHPEQDRVLSVRECARVQGFPDYYRFCGTVKERYRQIGNAVAVPVGRALGYAMALAWLKQSGNDPLMTLPPKFSFTHALQRAASSSSEVEGYHFQLAQDAEDANGVSFSEEVKLEAICKEVKHHVEVLTRELEGLPMTSDAVASIQRLLAIGDQQNSPLYKTRAACQPDAAERQANCSL